MKTTADFGQSKPHLRYSSKVEKKRKSEMSKHHRSLPLVIGRQNFFCKIVSNKLYLQFWKKIFNFDARSAFGCLYENITAHSCFGCMLVMSFHKALYVLN